MTRTNTKLNLILVWLASCALLTIICWPQISSGIGWDPDDQLRMVQLRDWLAGQSWFDTTQYRIAMPDSQPMHWSRWIELPLAAITLLLQPIFGSGTAQTIAMVLVPLLTLGCAMLLIWQISRRVFDEKVALFAAILTPTAIPLIAQIRPMRVDHHGWQLVLALVALWTMLWPEKRKAAIFLGGTLALWLSISLEGLPVSAAFIVFLVYRWAVSGHDGTRLFWTLLSFLAASLTLYLAAHGSFDLAENYCDAVSPVHLIACAAGAVIILPAIKFLPRHILARSCALVIAAIVALALLYTAAPQCLAGTFATMSPIVREYWLVNILEGLPIWYQQLPMVVTLFGGTILVGLCAMVALIIRRPIGAQLGVDRDNLAILIYAFLWAFLLAIFVQRGTAVAAAYSLPLTAWLIHAALVRARAVVKPLPRIFATAGLALLILPGPLLLALYDNITGNQSSALAAEPPAETARCDSNEALAQLHILPQANILAPFDYGPRILLLTPHSVVATSHHRNDHAMADQIRIFTLPADEARQIIASRKIDYIVICPDEAELNIYKKTSPKGLWGRVSEGNIPAWMQAVQLRDSELLVWKIVQNH